jgi:hypothetical protein
MDNEWGPFNKKLYHTTITQKMSLFCLFCRRTQWICSAPQTAEQSRTEWTFTVLVHRDVSIKLTICNNLRSVCHAGHREDKRKCDGSLPR